MRATRQISEVGRHAFTEIVDLSADAILAAAEGLRSRHSDIHLTFGDSLPKRGAIQSAGDDAGEVSHFGLKFRFPAPHVFEITFDSPEMLRKFRFKLLEHVTDPAAHERTEAFIHFGQGALVKYATLHDTVTACAFDVR